jgi:hypothetical protein
MIARAVHMGWRESEGAGREIAGSVAMAVWPCGIGSAGAHWSRGCTEGIREAHAGWRQKEGGSETSERRSTDRGGTIGDGGRKWNQRHGPAAAWPGKRR